MKDNWTTKVAVNARLTQKQFARVTALAKHDGVPFAEMLRKIVENGLEVTENKYANQA